MLIHPRLQNFLMRSIIFVLFYTFALWRQIRLYIKFKSNSIFENAILWLFMLLTFPSFISFKFPKEDGSNVMSSIIFRKELNLV